MSWRAILVSALVLLLCAGCEDRYALDMPGNMKEAALRLTPSVQAYRDTGFRSDHYTTFSLVPASALSDKARLNGILEKQVLFLLRCALEHRGYRLADSDEEPDLLISVDGSAPYHETEIPSRSVVLPQWVPGRTSYVSAYTFGSGSWGSSSTYGTVTTPGHVGMTTYTRPGYTQGNFYPSYGITVFDPQLAAVVWTGSGVGTSHNPDLRIGGQLVLAALIKEFPRAAHPEVIQPEWLGGISLVMFTPDGNTYFPTVWCENPRFAPTRCGLFVGDIIVSVNGTSTENRPLSEALRLLRGEPGTSISLEFLRNNRRRTKTLVIPPQKPVGK